MACVSGLTNGVYSFIDCCGTLQTGVSLGEGVCLDEAFTGTSFGIYIATGVTCTTNCSQGNLSYSFQVTGVTSATTGTLRFTPSGGIPPYTIDNVSPGSISAQTSSGTMTFTGLTGGTYVFRLNDSQGLQNNELYINSIVSSTFYANAYNVSGSTCGNSNGYVNITATTSASPYTVILYKDGSAFDVQSSNSLPFTYNDLSSGIYYATVFDYGSVTANTENFVINESTGVDFGIWKVNTSNCVIDKGKLAVTGITGTAPYTFLWSNNQTTQLITGLTEGTYSVTVTDSLGCSTTKSAIVGTAQPLGLGFLSTTNPSCFASDGSLTFTLTGGTVPFYYSASTGLVGYTLSDTFTISNLSSGAYQVLVRDANFCSTILNATTTAVNGFNLVAVDVTKSTCNTKNGQIKITINGAINNYTYAISGLTNNNTYGLTTQSQTHTFSDLPNDTYLLVISGSGTNCSYSEYVIIDSKEKFAVNSSTTGSTCGVSNGIVEITVGTGYTGVLDYVLSDGQSVIDTTLSGYTFEGLSPGPYTLEVTDAENCTVTENFTITSVGQIATYIDVTQCSGENDGAATVYINQGKPPFTYTWLGVSGNPTGNTVTGLSGGTYGVNIQDSNGCTTKHSFTIECNNRNILNYVISKICSNSSITQPLQKRGFSEMLNEGFVDLTSGYTNCVLSSATFTCEINIGGTAFTQNFYTSTGLNDVPSDSLWQTTIGDILDSIPEVGSYTIDLLNNSLQIKSDCNGDQDPLGGKSVTLELGIEYNINCESSANTMCFSYSSSTTGFSYTAYAQGINNNRPYYVINNPTDGDGFYGYVYWDDTYNVWVFSNTLNVDYNFAYSTLDNFYNPNPISNGTYTWSDGVYSDDHKMNSSSIGVCP